MLGDSLNCYYFFAGLEKFMFSFFCCFEGSYALKRSAHVLPRLQEHTLVEHGVDVGVE